MNNDKCHYDRQLLVDDYVGLQKLYRFQNRISTQTMKENRLYGSYFYTPQVLPFSYTPIVG